jgi:MoxR-like ATPase
MWAKAHATEAQHNIGRPAKKVSLPQAAENLSDFAASPRIQIRNQNRMQQIETSNAPPAPPEVLEFISAIRERVATVVVGQDVVVERLLIALFTGGHLLLQGVPGLAKTLLVSALSKTVDLAFARIQFTIDLLPSDIVGSEILDQRTNEFRTHKGPIFTNLLLADEINRAAPKVQSALLEAMQERKVTIGAETFSLPAPFLVIATQNPIEQSGTFELPEAQLDRFMLCHRLDYPTPGEEREVLRRNALLGIRREDRGAIARTEFDILEKEPVGSSERLVAAMEAVHQVHVSDTFLEHVVEIVGRTRKHSAVDLGCSPRAGISLIKGSRARALIHGRNYVVPADLYALAEDVMLHRMRLGYEALADGLTSAGVLQEILGEMGGQKASRNGAPVHESVV